MQKESLLFFSFLSESTFGGAKGTNKRAKYKINDDLFLFPSESTFDEVKGTNKPADCKRNMCFSSPFHFLLLFLQKE